MVARMHSPYFFVPLMPLTLGERMLGKRSEGPRKRRTDDKSSGENKRGSLLNEEFLLCFVSTTQAQSSPFHTRL